MLIHLVQYSSSDCGLDDCPTCIGVSLLFLEVIIPLLLTLQRMITFMEVTGLNHLLLPLNLGASVSSETPNGAAHENPSIPIFLG